MSKDIYDNEENLQLSESADIYSPHEQKVFGEIDGEQYEILINDRSLPAGIPPDPAVITKVIPWDKKFYMEWEIQGSPDTDVFVTDAGAEVAILEGYTQKSVIFDGPSLVNGTQYDLQVVADILNIRTESLISNVTLFDVTLSGLSVTPGSTTVDVTWDGIPEVAAWEVTLINNDGNVQVDKVTKLQGATSATLEGVEPYQNYTVQLQAFSEGKVFSSSKATETFSTQRVVYVTEGSTELNVYDAKDGSFIINGASGDDYGGYGMDYDPIRNRLVTANYRGRIRCWDINADWSLTEVWNYPSPTGWDFINMPVFDYEGDVYFVDYDSGYKLVKLSGVDGSLIWEVFPNQIGDTSTNLNVGFDIHPLGIVIGDTNEGQLHFHSTEDGSHIKTCAVPAEDGGNIFTDYTKTPHCDQFGNIFCWSTGNPNSASERAVIKFIDSKGPSSGPTLIFERYSGYETVGGIVSKSRFSRVRGNDSNLRIYDAETEAHLYAVGYRSFADAHDPAYQYMPMHSFDLDENLYTDGYTDTGRPLTRTNPDGTQEWQNDIGNISGICAVPNGKPYPWIATAADLSIEQVDVDGVDITVWAWSSNPTIEYALYDQAGTTEVVAWQKSRQLSAPSDGTYTVKVRDRVQTTPIEQEVTIVPVTIFNTDFSEYSDGDLTTQGWSLLASSAKSLEVRSNGYPYNNKEGFLFGNAGFDIHSASPDDAGTIQDCEVLGLIKAQEASTYSSCIFVRMNAKSGYMFAVEPSRVIIYVLDGTGGFSSLIGSVTKSTSVTSWNWVRVSIQGNALKLKTWPQGSAEPEAWDTEVTNSTHTSAGNVGFGTRRDTSDTECAYFAVSDGTTIPLPT